MRQHGALRRARRAAGCTAAALMSLGRDGRPFRRGGASGTARKRSSPAASSPPQARIRSEDDARDGALLQQPGVRCRPAPGSPWSPGIVAPLSSRLCRDLPAAHRAPRDHHPRARPQHGEESHRMPGRVSAVKRDAISPRPTPRRDQPRRDAVRQAPSARHS
jgi:hypothetical protein